MSGPFVMKRFYYIPKWSYVFLFHNALEKLTQDAAIWQFFQTNQSSAPYFTALATYNSNNTLTISSPIKMSFSFANCNINRTSLIANKSISMLDSKKFQNLELNTEFWQTINWSKSIPRLIFMQITGTYLAQVLWVL